jgi:sodium-dependent dicarboxylate transporter 2/3/5
LRLHSNTCNHISPSPEGLTLGGKNLVGLFAVALILWVTEGIPIAVTSLLVIAAQPVFQITTPPEAIAGFMTALMTWVAPLLGLL